ncbi:hypothetical protein [Erwinia rhapontici]|uniref:hypothetical protein n=1 Tax=Erwinia rhapontici TaxID=55212 RepID=UPI00216972BE|nr:hypothetical protein [Erwinia rhapontici]MCS3610034.1 hypothetical protein [Erwinia rhapontici]
MKEIESGGTKLYLSRFLIESSKQTNALNQFKKSIEELQKVNLAFQEEIKDLTISEEHKQFLIDNLKNQYDNLTNQQIAVLTISENRVSNLKLNDEVARSFITE